MQQVEKRFDFTLVIETFLLGWDLLGLVCQQRGILRRRHSVASDLIHPAEYLRGSSHSMCYVTGYCKQ